MHRRLILGILLLFVFFSNLYVTAGEEGKSFSIPGNALGGPVLTGSSEQRVALIVGNADYQSSPLRNPANDAKSMAGVLKGLGFNVTERLNLGQNGMKRAIDEFGQKLLDGGVGLFYYSGHGLQVNGINYLIPVDAKIQAEADVEYEAVDVGRVLAKMETARNRMNIVVLDACRNNPFRRGFRSNNSGLAFMNAPSGTIIAYATAPGSVADDGAGNIGLYTGELIKKMQVPGLKIEDVFKQVRAGVQGATEGKQVPWESVSIVGDFYFNSSSSPAARPNGQLCIKADPPDAKIRLMNSQVAFRPCMELDEGQYQIEISKEGYETIRKSVQVSNARTLDLNVALKSLKVTIPPQPMPSPSSTSPPASEKIAEPVHNLFRAWKSLNYDLYMAQWAPGAVQYYGRDHRRRSLDEIIQKRSEDFKKYRRVVTSYRILETRVTGDTAEIHVEYYMTFTKHDGREVADGTNAKPNREVYRLIYNPNKKCWLVKENFDYL